MDISAPMPIENQTIEFQKLTLMTGMNGTGKSFWLINAYVLAKIASSIIMGATEPAPLAGVSQFFFDNCFNDFNTDGIVACEFTSGAAIRVVLKEGKVQVVDHTGLEDVKDVVRIKYLSTGMRTFDDIKGFLGMRNMVKRIAGDNMETYIEEMMKVYKFYDFEHVESMIARMPLETNQKILETLEKFDIKEDIIRFGFDESKPDFFLVEKTEKGEIVKYFTSFGKGHQSIFNMLLANLTL